MDYPSDLHMDLSSARSTPKPEADAPDVPVFPSGATGVFGSVVNLSNSVLGLGSLFLGESAAQAGLLCYLFIMISVGIICALTYRYIAISGDLVHEKCFRGIEKRIFPKMGNLAEISALLVSLCFNVGYFITISENLQRLAITLFGYQIWINKPVILLTVATVFILPLSLLRSMDKLKYTSSLSMGAIIYTAILVSFYGIKRLIAGEISFSLVTTTVPEDDSVVMFIFSSALLYSCPLCITAFGGHFNCMGVYNSMKERNVATFSKVVKYSTILICLVYTMCGVGAYLAFGSTIQGDVLSVLPSNVWCNISQAAMSVVLICSSPLMTFCSRQAISSVFFKRSLSFSEHNLVSICIWTFTAGCALVLTDVSLLISIVGQTAMLALCFILPPVFVLKLTKDPNSVFSSLFDGRSRHRFYSISILVIGILLFCGASVVTYQNIVAAFS